MLTFKLDELGGIRMKKLLIVLVILILLGALGYIAWKYMSGPVDPGIVTEITPTPVVEKKVTADDILVETVKYENKTDNMDIKCEYPRIKSFKNASFQNSVNSEIAKHSLDQVNEIKNVIEDDTDDLKPEMFIRYSCNFERFNYGKYLFLVVSHDYESGGIRSNKWKDIYSINVETERIVYLSEMFEVGVKYEQAIISEITKQAAERDIELMGGNGIEKLSQKQSFYINEEGKLVVYFQPSFVAATVYGEVSFVMPFTLNSQGYFEIK